MEAGLHGVAVGLNALDPVEEGLKQEPEHAPILSKLKHKNES